jgi:hypothetical protein
MGKSELETNMNTKKWIARGLFLLCIVIQSGCQSYSNNSPGNTVSTDSPTKTVKIKALIDGADTVKVQGHKVWYEHESWDLPGRWQGRDEPTIINGKTWRPEWNGETSVAFESLKPAFNPQSPEETRLTKLTGRGEVTISQMPSPENNQTLAIHFDDAPFQGAAWYEVVVNWK